MSLWFYVNDNELQFRWADNRSSRSRVNRLVMCTCATILFWLIGINSQREFRSEHKHTDAHHTKRADQEEGGAEEGEKDRKKKERNRNIKQTFITNQSFLKSLVVFI
jgi:hypothetical protein